jgi:hypothetical protein
MTWSPWTSGRKAGQRTRTIIGGLAVGIAIGVLNHRLLGLARIGGRSGGTAGVSGLPSLFLIRYLVAAVALLTFWLWSHSGPGVIALAFGLIGSGRVLLRTALHRGGDRP